MKKFTLPGMTVELERLLVSAEDLFSQYMDYCAEADKAIPVFESAIKELEALLDSLKESRVSMSAALAGRLDFSNLTELPERLLQFEQLEELPVLQSFWQLLSELINQAELGSIRKDSLKLLEIINQEIHWSARLALLKAQLALIKAPVNSAEFIVLEGSFSSAHHSMKVAINLNELIRFSLQLTSLYTGIVHSIGLGD